MSGCLEVTVALMSDRRRRARVLAAALAATACSGEPTPPTSVRVASVEIQPVSLTVVWTPWGEGASPSWAFTAVARNARGNAIADRPITWMSSDPGRVRVTPGEPGTPSATVTPVGFGSATITATIEGKSAQSTVTVNPPPVDALFAWPDTSRLPVSATRRLTLRPTRGHHVSGVVIPALTWETSDPSVATVDADGLVTAVGVGQATITATTLAGHRYPFEVFAFRYPAPLQFASVSSGGDHTCALTKNGVAYCWGLNGQGQLGSDAVMDRCALSTTTAGFLSSIRWFRCSEYPVPVNTTLRFASVSVGGAATCALALDGAAYCWGTKLGTADAATPYPTPVAGGLAFRTLDVGAGRACGVSTSDAAYCWGGGALGTGSEGGSPDPVPVTGGLAWRDVRVDGHGTSCGVTTDNVAYCWGNNTLGQLGVPPGSQSCGGGSSCATPVRVRGDVRFSQVEPANITTCGLATDGAAWCWGRLPLNGQYTTDPNPTAVPGGLRFVSLGATGTGDMCGLTEAGATYCWGFSTVRALDGRMANPVTEGPVRTVPEFPIRVLAAGASSCGIDASTVLYCWDVYWNPYAPNYPFWRGAWSVGSPTPVRVAGQE